MSDFFLTIYRFIKPNRQIALFVLMCGLLLCAYFTSRIKFSEDISKILPDTENINNMNFVYSNSKFLDKVIINISLKDTSISNPELLSEFANAFTDTIVNKYIPDYIDNIEFAPNQNKIFDVYSFAYNNLPIFLTPEDYLTIDTIITSDNIKKTIESNYGTLLSPASMFSKKLIAIDPLFITPLALSKLASFNTDSNFGIYEKFFISHDNKNLIVIFTPTSTNNTSNNTKLFNEIDELILQLSTDKFSEISVEYFGNPVVALGNANQIKNDIILTVTLALLILIIVITLFFKRKRTFFIIFLPVGFGALVSLAIIYLVKGEISAISLGIGSVLLGISVDYALHIYSHFRDNKSYKSIFKNLSTPIILSSLTTASAFLSLYFINSEALNDLGLFAGISIISAALFSLIVLPHLVSTKSADKSHKNNLIDKIAAYNFHKSSYLKIFIVLATIVLFFASKNVGFNADMMKNNFMSEKTKSAEKKLNNVTNLSKKTIYIVSPGSNTEIALTNNQQLLGIIDSLQNTDIIQSASVINRVFPDKANQLIAIKRWNDFWRDKKDRVIADIEKSATEKGFRKNAFTKFTTLLQKEHLPISIENSGVINDKIFSNFVIKTDTMSGIINVLKVNNTNKDIESVYKAFEGNSLAWVIDKRLITSEFMNILNDNFNKLIIISLIFVFIILLLAYGRIELTIITMIPIIISWIWTVGIMGLTGIEFNIFNVIIMTFIFGLGIDYSIFIMRGLLMQYKFGESNIKSYKVSVILSGITTLLGIGVLIFAKHPALKSIATMSIIGILSVIFITFTLLPAIFNWLVNYSKGPRNRPITFVDFIYSMWAFFVFVTGSFVLSLLSLFMIIIPISRTKKKEFIHRLFKHLTWFMIYMNFTSPKIVINPNNEDYKKPAIIIANHQSHIDLMLMMLLNWRVVVLTNSRNFTNIMYGPALRYAGFIEVNGNYDNILDQVKQQTSEGYSVVIFPEGHRSEKGKLKRFHKGAFYLANELGLDILPIIIYGQKEALKKSEFFLKRATAVTKFLPRIKLSEGKYGDNTREQAKNVKKYFEKEYIEVAKMLETPDYFNDFIKKNYLYKGPVLEWYTRVKLKLEDNYQIFDELIPKKCTITDLGCGYGFLDYMLHLLSPERKITGIDYDDDKISVAKNVAIRNNSVNFFAADINNIEILNSDVFIISDVLHYMPKELQVNIVEKCIAKLNPNGMIIIRDADKDLGKRHIGTKITEFFSTNIGFNQTKYNLEFVSGSIIREITKSHNMKLEIIDNTKRTSNLIFVLR